MQLIIGSSKVCMYVLIHLLSSIALVYLHTQHHWVKQQCGPAIQGRAAWRAAGTQDLRLMQCSMSF